MLAPVKASRISGPRFPIHAPEAASTQKPVIKKADAFAEKTVLAKSEAPNVEQPALPAATRAALGSLQSDVEKLVPVKSYQRVVQIGASVESAHPYLSAGANVIALDPSREGLDSAKQRQLRFHHLACGTLDQPLSKIGVRDGNEDLVIATGQLPTTNLAEGLARISTALAPSGIFAWTYEGNDAGEALERAGFEVLKNELSSSSGIGFGESPMRVLIARKPGQHIEVPKDLERMDRTTCVDRAAVLAAHAGAPLEGPRSLKVVPGSDPQLRSELNAMLDAVTNDLGIDPSKVPLPSHVAREATLGKSGCDALVLLAHPDDETGFSGGTLRAAADHGKSIKIASVTGGEGGRSSSGATGDALAKSRGEELQHVSQLLGAKGIELMGFSDFGKYVDTQRSVPATRKDSLQKWGLMPLLEKMVRSIRENRPSTLLTFDAKHDPDYALHGHHLATGLAATLAFHLAGDPSAFPDQIKQGLKPWTPQRQLAISSNERSGERFAKISIDPQRKREALQAHGTQVYSLEKMFEALDSRQPYALEETWHLTQARDGGAMSKDPLDSLFSIAKSMP
jgi:LmbE family N-acetylglucosaminyl deacetylase